MRVRGEAQFAPPRRERVVASQTSEKRLADPTDQLQRLDRHRGSYSAAQHAEHAADRAGFDGVLVRDVGEDISKHGTSSWPEDTDLAGELMDTPPDHRSARALGGVADEVTGREVVA